MESKIGEDIELERIQNDLMRLFDGYRKEKEKQADTQKAILNILDDFVAEKANLENYQKALLNILDDYQLEKRKVEKFNEELLLSNKEQESFSYSVSHDLRAPIRAINGFSRIIKENYYEIIDNDGKELLDLVIEEASRMGRLIDDLLSFSRLGKKDIEKSYVDMQALVKNVHNNVLKFSETTPKAKFKFQNLPNCWCDSTLIRQVWVNLITNAIKFTESVEKPVIEIGHKSNNGFDIFYVKDNGIGFDMKYYDKLFGVFQSLHSAREYEGNGIGLAIVNRIIVRHGGKVWAEGEVKKGATFYFSVPMH